VAEPASRQKAEALPLLAQMVEQPVRERQTVPEAERRMVAVVQESGQQTAWEPVPERRTEQEVEQQKVAAAALVGEPVLQMVEVLARAH
jgi:hypothetical protein